MEKQSVVERNIPVELKGLDQWCVWKWIDRDGKRTKPPFQPNGKFAEVDNPNTWAPYLTAMQAVQESDKWDGPGFMLTEEYAGIDWDDCISPDGTIDPAILQQVKAIDSYTEISPSGTGLKTLVRGKLPAGDHHGKTIGVFNHTRYFCITGRVLDCVSKEIEYRQEQLDALVRRYWPGDFTPKQSTAEQHQSQPLSLADSNIIEKAFSSNDGKLRRLWGGDWSDYTSQSEADQALCFKLAFWVGKDPERIDILFRQSGLSRDKWKNRADYRQRTILRAIAMTSEVYTGRTPAKQPSAAIKEKPVTTPEEVEDSEPYDIFGETMLTGKPEWPEGACPKAIDAFARDEAERIGVDVAMVALPAIGYAAIATRDSFRIQPKANDPTWLELPILWLAVVAGAGSKKTPALKSAKKPIFKIAHELRQAHIEDMARYTSDYQRWMDNKKDGTEPARPIERRLFTDDSTVEALRDIMENHHDGLGIIKDELSSWITSFDIYRGGGKGGKDRADYCELYQGGGKSFDRAGKGHVWVPHWGASIVGGIQPGPVSRLMGDITDDGLVARFLVAVCERDGNGVDRAPNTVAIETYSSAIRALTNLKPQYEAEIFKFEDKAQPYRHIIRDLAQTIQILPDSSEALKAHLNKWEAAFCRLALIYHVVEAAAAGEYPSRLINESTARMAATLMTDFLLPNSIRFYSEIIDTGKQSHHAQWVAGYLLENRVEKVTRRQLVADCRPFFKSPNLLDTAMRALYVANWIESDRHKKDGTITSWTVNQKIYERFALKAAAERDRRAAIKKQIQEAVQKIRAKEAKNGAA